MELLDHCSGVDGTWGMQARWYDRGLKVASKLLAGAQRLAPDPIVSDCPLAALRIQEGTGQRVRHPIMVLLDAYGLGEGS